MSGEFLEHGACEKCGSKDNVAWYRKPNGQIDGTCFGCGEFYVKEKAVEFINIPEDLTINTLPNTEALYCYKNIDGEILFYVDRFINPGGKKEFRPISWDGKKQHYKKRDILALYGAELLKYNDRVLVVEGEKAADAARQLLPQLATVTWQGGSNAVKNGDWKLLEGKTVYLMPDNDAPGFKAMKELVNLLPECTLYWLDTSILGEGEDIADNIAPDVISSLFENKELIKEPLIKEGRCTLDILKANIAGFKDSFIDVALGGEKFVSLKVPGISVIEGRSGHGKSTLMYNMALDLLKQGKHVAIFNYEMTNVEVFTRLLMAARGEQLDIDGAKNYCKFIEDAAEGLSEEAKVLKDYVATEQLDIFGSDSTKLYASDDILKFLNRSCKSNSVVVIDYIQILPVNSTYNNPQYKVIKDLVYGLLPTIAKKKIHVLLGSQLSGEGYETIFDSPRESKDITNVSSLSLRVWNKNTPIHLKLEEQYEELKDNKNEKIQVRKPPYASTKGNFIVDCSKNRWGQPFTKGFDLKAGSKLILPNQNNSLTLAKIDDKINNII